ncbi:PIN domain-containing protein [Nocardia mangyaensis]|uniref:PIN domain-containing protein n=1 Tax=Nocardia mangyaensis TaxID=2213200 RepID=UPI0026775025|nr:PIN domain-containing protein [Nocardia mangyaensis]MDO3648912.1 VapC toxin family PIN domain ribonuclease [Nocardia mangyaensis]
MAVTARFLVDTSAFARMRHSEVASEIVPLIEAGLVATCAAFDVEALYSARSPVEYEQVRADRRALFEYLPTNDEHWHSAFAVQRELARSGRHRAVGIHDLLASVLAVEHRLVLLHYDADFETVASVVDLNHRWVAPRGTLEAS